MNRGRGPPTEFVSKRCIGGTGGRQVGPKRKGPSGLGSRSLLHGASTEDLAAPFRTPPTGESASGPGNHRAPHEVVSTLPVVPWTPWLGCGLRSEGRSGRSPGHTRWATGSGWDYAPLIIRPEPRAGQKAAEERAAADWGSTVASDISAQRFVVCRACSTAWGCKSPTQPDGGEVLAKRKGVAARRGLKEAWSQTAT